ncbi:hypothetical protein RYX36_019821, partial [Vicia faba]
RFLRKLKKTNDFQFVKLLFFFISYGKGQYIVNGCCLSFYARFLDIGNDANDSELSA